MISKHVTLLVLCLLVEFNLSVMELMQAENHDGDNDGPQCRCQERCSLAEYESGYCRMSSLWWGRTRRCCKLDCEDCRCTDHCKPGETLLGYCRQSGWQYKCCKCEVGRSGDRKYQE